MSNFCSERNDGCYGALMIAVQVVGFTDVGRQRENNEDGFGVWPNENLFAVCDGMGGGRTGDVATKIALESLYAGFCTQVAPGGYRTSAGLHGFDRLRRAVQIANRRIFEKSKSSPMYVGIAAAIAAISIEGETIFIAHIGDCRIYRFRMKQLEQLTQDHSLVNEARKYKPQATEEELAQIPANILVRVLGLKDEIEVEEHRERAYPGDLYLLCTDGIHCLIDNAAIEKILKANTDLAKTAQTLLDAALDAGGTDNIAAVLVQCSSE